MTFEEQNFRRVGYGRGGRHIGWLSTRIVQGSALRSYSAVRATGHKTPGESSVNITVSV